MPNNPAVEIGSALARSTLFTPRNRCSGHFFPLNSGARFLIERTLQQRSFSINGQALTAAGLICSVVIGPFTQTYIEPILLTTSLSLVEVSGRFKTRPISGLVSIAESTVRLPLLSGSELYTLLDLTRCPTARQCSPDCPNSGCGWTNEAF